MGATSLSLTTFIVMTVSITIKNVTLRIMIFHTEILSDVVQNATMLSAFGIPILIIKTLQNGIKFITEDTKVKLTNIATIYNEY
jgi:hypothetical protein